MIDLDMDLFMLRLSIKHFDNLETEELKKGLFNQEQEKDRRTIETDISELEGFTMKLILNSVEIEIDEDGNRTGNIKVGFSGTLPISDIEWVRASLGKESDFKEVFE